MLPAKVGELSHQQEDDRYKEIRGVVREKRRSVLLRKLKPAFCSTDAIVRPMAHEQTQARLQVMNKHLS